MHLKRKVSSNWHYYDWGLGNWSLYQWTEDTRKATVTYMVPSKLFVNNIFLKAVKRINRLLTKGNRVRGDVGLSQ